MGKRLKQGEKYKVDYTKNQILLILCEHPEGIDEPELRDIIKLRINISDPKGIKDHLKALENKGFVSKKEQIGKENIWLLKTESFSGLSDRFLDEDEKYAFHISAYCQSMIAPPLLREIEKLWNLKAPYISEKEFEPLIEAYYKQYRENQAERSKKFITAIEGISDEDTDYIYSDDFDTDERGARAPYYMRPDFFTEEDVLEILKLSPTALQKALNGTPIKEKPSQILLQPTGTFVPDLTPVDTLIRGYFQEMLLACLILDSGTRHYPNFYFKPELSIKFRSHGRGEFEKKAGMVRDHVTYQYFKKIEDT